MSLTPNTSRDKNFDQIPAMELGATQILAISGTAANSTVFTNGSVVRIASTADCHIAIGDTAVATTSDAILKATYEYFTVPAGERVSVIQISGGSTGSVSVTECD